LSGVSAKSQLIHNSFKIALKAAQMLKVNSSIIANQTKTLKLRAPPKFCPFSSDIFCDKTQKYREIDGSCNNLGKNIDYFI
jgi:hypothetical protein